MGLGRLKSRPREVVQPQLVILERVSNGELAAVLRYLEQGGNPNATMHTGGPEGRVWRPLNAAVCAYHFTPEHLEIVRALLAHGATVDRDVLNDFRCEGMFSAPWEWEAMELLRRNAPPELRGDEPSFRSWKEVFEWSRAQAKREEAERGRLSFAEVRGKLSIADRAGALSRSKRDSRPE